MSQSIKIAVSDENYEILNKKAAAENLSIQDYIRRKLFGKINITPQDAVNRALKKYKPGDAPFSVPELFEPEEWETLATLAGPFGRRFFELVDGNYPQIKFTGNYNKKGQALYCIV